MLQSEPYVGSAKLPLIVRASWLIPNPGARRDQIALNIAIARGTKYSRTC